MRATVLVCTDAWVLRGHSLPPSNVSLFRQRDSRRIIRNLESESWNLFLIAGDGWAVIVFDEGRGIDAAIRPFP
jgi:hypothetical protein